MQNSLNFLEYFIIKGYHNDSTITCTHTQMIHHSDGSDDPAYDFQVGSSLTCTLRRLLKSLLLMFVHADCLKMKTNATHGQPYNMYANIMHISQEHNN